MITIERCPCGDCETYGLSDGTFFQGNGWPKELAQRHADCFNAMDCIDDPLAYRRDVLTLTIRSQAVMERYAFHTEDGICKPAEQAQEIADLMEILEKFT